MNASRAETIDDDPVPTSAAPASEQRAEAFADEPGAEQTPDGPPAEQGAAVPVTRRAPPSMRRGLIYLAICLAFAAALVVPNLFGGASSSAPDPCDEGGTIAQVLAVSGQGGAAPYLLAVVRPQAFPNVVPGDEPGCDVLYRSDDQGLTWTVSFSATAEAPSLVALAPGSGQVYLLTERMHFPLYLAGNIYRSDQQAVAWTWDRISPQGRHDVPAVTATDMQVLDDGSVVLREGNGDGAALVISRDGGVTWQPIVIPIPQLGSVGSLATLGNQIAIAAPLLTSGQAPGAISADHGAHWQAMGVLPGAPPWPDLRPLLSVDAPESALVLDLVPDTVVGSGGSVARYYSRDGGLHWTRVRCGAQPGPGCAVAARWARTGDVRYALYRRQVYQQRGGGAWTPLPKPLPVPSDQVLQLVAATGGGRPYLYLVTAGAIWRWDGAAWQALTARLPLGAPPPTAV